jgi:hypothetical protein
MSKYYTSADVVHDLGVFTRFPNQKYPAYRDYYDWEDVDRGLLVKARLLEYTGGVLAELCKDLLAKRKAKAKTYKKRFENTKNESLKDLTPVISSDPF